MSDFLSNLLDRAQERAPTLQRRRPSLFEPRRETGWEASPWGGALPQDGEDAEAWARPHTSARSDRRDAAPPLEFAEPQPPAFAVMPQAFAARPEQAPPSSSPSREAMPHAVSHQSDRDNQGAASNAAPPAVAANPPALLRLVETRVEKTVEHLPPVNPFAAQERQSENAVSPPLVAPTSAAKPPAAPTVQVDASIRTPSGARASLPEGRGTEGRAMPTPVVPRLPQPQGPAFPAQRRQPPPERTAASASPTIQVTIGRVEVRATAAKPAAAAAARPAAPKLSLEDYLKSRSGGGR